MKFTITDQESSFMGFELEYLNQNRFDRFMEVRTLRENGLVHLVFEGDGGEPLSHRITEKPFRVKDFAEVAKAFYLAKDEISPFPLAPEKIGTEPGEIVIDERGRCFFQYIPRKNRTQELEVHEKLLSLLLKVQIQGDQDGLALYKELFRSLQARNYIEGEVRRLLDEELETKVPEESGTYDEFDEFYENDRIRKGGKEQGEQKKRWLQWPRLDRRIYQRLEIGMMLLWCVYLAGVLFLDIGIQEALGGSVVFLILVFFIRSKSKNPGDSEKPREELEKEKTEGFEELCHMEPECDKIVDGLKSVMERDQLFNCTETMNLLEFRRPHILYKSGGDETSDRNPIYINEGIFLGRNKDLVDVYIPDLTVGKVHCEVWNENRLTYIKDMHSRNGTWLNEVRIEPGIGIELKDEDLIGIGQSQFSFHII